MEDLGAPVVKGDEKSGLMLQRKSRKILLFLLPSKVTKHPKNSKKKKKDEDEMRMRKKTGRNGTWDKEEPMKTKTLWY